MSLSDNSSRTLPKLIIVAFPFEEPERFVGCFVNSGCGVTVLAGFGGFGSMLLIVGSMTLSDRSVRIMGGSRNGSFILISVLSVPIVTSEVFVLWLRSLRNLGEFIVLPMTPASSSWC